MNVRISIKDPEGEYENTIQITDIADPERFSYLDSDGARCFLEVGDEEICIRRDAPDHCSELLLKEGGCLIISSPEGSITFSLKAIEIRKNNDIITVVYSIDNVTRSIVIEYIGV